MKKLTGFMLAAAFAVTGSISTNVGAQTVSDLQAQIDALLAQLSAVATTGTTTTATGYSFVSDLTIGSTGPAVVELQTALELQGTLVMPAGVSRGYFGPLTQAALGMYQASVGISPASGYFGPITRAHFNSLVAPTTPGTIVMPGTTPGTGSSNDLSGDEASLEDFSMDSEDDAEEGEMKRVATVEFDVEDGDFKMERLDLTFSNEDVRGNADDEPWDVYETIHLAINGNVFAEEDVDDEDDWNRDNNPFTFRMSGLDEIIDEGDTFEFEIWLTTQNNVDDADGANWVIYIAKEGIRGLDGAGITQYGGADNIAFDEEGKTSGETVSFSINEEGGDEEIKIKSSNNDPDSALLRVDEDDEVEHAVFVFKLEAEENDIEIDEIVLEVILGGVNYATAINDVTLEIGNDEVNDFDVAPSPFTGTCAGVDTESTNSNDCLDDAVNGGAGTYTASPNAVILTFDVDGDFEIDGDDDEEVTVNVEFRKADPNNDGLDEGIFETLAVKTIQVGVHSVDGEGVGDVEAESSLKGSVHTLTLTSAEITNISWKVTESQNSTTGTIDFMFTVNNSDSDEDFDIDSLSILDTATAAFTNAVGFGTGSGEGVLSRVSGDSASSVGTVFTVDEGDTVGFRVRYTARDAGTFEASITEVAGVELKDSDELSPTLIL